MSDGTQHYPSLWSNTAFVRLFWAHAGSLIGNAVSVAALGLLAKELTGADDASAVMGIVMTIRIAVVVFVAPFAGALADRIGRRVCLVATDVLRAGIVIGFLFVDSVWQIYVLAFFLNLGSAIFTPVYKAVVPGIVGEKDYPRALAFGSMAYKISDIAGPALAAFIVLKFGFRGNFAIDAGTFLLSALLVLSTRFASHGSSSDQKARARVSYGVRQMLTVPGLRSSLLLSLQESVVGAFVIVSTVSYVTGELELADDRYPLAGAMPGVGAMIVAIVYGFKVEAVRRVLARGWFVLLVAALVMVGAVKGYGTLLAAWVLAGAGTTVLGIRSNELLAANSEEEDRAHIYAAHFSLSHVGWGIFYPLCGFLSTQIGFNPTAWVLLGILVVLALLARRS